MGFLKKTNIKNMGELRLSVYAKWQIGLSVSYEYGSQLVLRIPFATIIVSLSKEANGIEIFGVYI